MCSPRLSLVVARYVRAAAALTLLLLGPVAAATAGAGPGQEQDKRRDVVVFVDDSLSMGTHDDYTPDRDVRAAVEKLAARLHPGKDAAAKVTRLQLAQALLAHGEAAWLGRLAAGARWRVHVYNLAPSGKAVKLCTVTDKKDPRQLAEALRKVRELKPHARSSPLGAAVRQVLTDFRGKPLAAMILLTDGVTTHGDGLDRAARDAARAGVPLFFVGLGSSRAWPRLRLEDVSAPETAVAGKPVVFRARLAWQGATALPVRVKLYERDGDRLVTLQTREVKVPAGGKPAQVVLKHQPGKAGAKVYVVRAEPADGRGAGLEALPEDLSGQQTILIREQKPIRVLYVEGAPRWEYRFIKSLFEKEGADKNALAVSLRVLLLGASEDYAKQDRSALAAFPNRKELDAYDVVILGDADPRDPRLGARNLKNLADFVRTHGGGLLMIAGSRHAPHSYKGTPLEAVLPVVVEGQPDARDAREGFRPQRTPAGQAHPLFRFADAAKENEAAWAELPPLFWWAEGYRARPSALVLATHPTARAGPGKPQPLVLEQFVASGRSLFFGIDETWRWRSRSPARFAQFWMQAVSHLERSVPARVRLLLDRRGPYGLGETIRVRVSFPDDGPPGPETVVKVAVEVVPPGPGGSEKAETRTLTLAKVAGLRALYEATLAATREGTYRFRLRVPAVAEITPEAECRVVVPGERSQLRMNREEMMAAARGTNGRFYALDEVDSLLADLPRAP